jgi:hypothetical protein
MRIPGIDTGVRLVKGGPSVENPLLALVRKLFSQSIATSQGTTVEIRVTSCSWKEGRSRSW